MTQALTREVLHGVRSISPNVVINYHKLYSVTQIDGLGQALLEELWNVEIWRGIATMDFSLSELKPGNIFKIEILDKDHENIHNYWVPMGKPEPPTREQIKTMKEFANILKQNLLLRIKMEISIINRLLLTGVWY